MGFFASPPVSSIRIVEVSADFAALGSSFPDWAWDATEKASRDAATNATGQPNEVTDARLARVLARMVISKIPRSKLVYILIRSDRKLRNAKGAPVGRDNKQF